MMTELLSNLTWPGAIAIIGSVVTVVGGIVALFATYFSSKNANTNTPALPKSLLSQPEDTQVHARISANKDRISNMEGKLLVLETQIANMIRELEHHDQRDVDDFKTINAKVDKLMEIIVEMLKDE